MIFARLDGGENCCVYPAAIQKALEYLKNTDVMALSLGRHNIDGDHIFMNVMDMTTHPFEGSHPEIHEKYADLFYWPEGGVPHRPGRVLRCILPLGCPSPRPDVG